MIGLGREPVARADGCTGVTSLAGASAAPRKRRQASALPNAPLRGGSADFEMVLAPLPASVALDPREIGQREEIVSIDIPPSFA